MAERSSVGPEVPGAHSGTVHPAIATRLLEDMESMANLVDQTPAAGFTGDEAWTTLHRLMASLGSLAEEADSHRPVPFLPPVG